MSKRITRRQLFKAGAAISAGLALVKVPEIALARPEQAAAIQPPPPNEKRRIGPADRRAAAARRKAVGVKPGAAQIAADPTLDRRLPAHYFGPYANYANSPMPKGTIGSIVVDAGGTGYSATPTVTIDDAYGTGSGATATATVAAGVITAITVGAAGSNYTAPFVTIEDATGIDAAATPVLAGPFTGGIRKFVDRLAGLDPATPNGLSQFIPIAEPDKTTYPGCDYYEIELGEYNQKFHSDLPTTRLRGYRQTNTTSAANQFHYLGPLIIAQRGVPVRMRFTNDLPTDAAGKLFIPVDKTVMGAGNGPLGTPYSENRACIHNHGAFTPWISDGTPHQWIVPANETTDYHEGVSVRDVPDMWFDSNNNYAVIPGASLNQPPSYPGAVNNPGPGSQTYYFTNEQSARLMFYHDHAFGITRLNVYVGEAGGYLITDQVEKDMIDGTNKTGVNPTLAQVLPDIGIPLIIQDKTFVDETTIGAQDPTWRWGTNTTLRASDGLPQPRTGDLWVPSVYMPAQNPWDMSGASAFGRWQYGPWFWPPTPLANPPVANEYYNALDPLSIEPPYRPDVPSPSMGMEAFNDVLLVNGTVYPYVELQPQTYRFRILSVANDRFFNLHFYVADPAYVAPNGFATEVKMVPALKTAGFPPLWSTDGREGGVPDPATRGPSWIQIGTEGGFLPAPVVIAPQPLNWNMNATAFNVGNVTDHSLLLGPAERADVLVDFSAFAGQTLILYNDAPAAFPALDPRYDYYTGNPNQMDTGGAPTTQPGYGPNVRTVMQIRVANTAPAAAYNLATLQSVFTKTASKRGVFEVSQDQIIFPQAVYNTAYNATFPSTAMAQYVNLFETQKTFVPVGTNTPVTIPFQEKAIHDEMGAAYDQTYGRMSGLLGLELLNTTNLTQNIILYGYESPPTDILVNSFTPLGTLLDGTQIWKITHNGVDTHPIHFHLVNVQLINRVAWDGAMLPPEANELGWKETVRVNPLENTIVAMRPMVPPVPFDITDSVRYISPAEPADAILEGPPGGFKDPVLNGVTVTNHLVNFGWEYVWHCHILSHEEMDMMHSLVFAYAPPPTHLVAKWLTGPTRVQLTWVNHTQSGPYPVVQRATNASFTQNLVIIPMTSRVTTYTDATVTANTLYYYRIVQTNTAGDTTFYPAPSVGFPTATSTAYSNVVTGRVWSDFNGDGRADILWRNTVSGENRVRLMNGSTVVTNGVLPVIADLNWQPVAVGDFNGDGYADVLWRHTTTGDNQIWQMNGTTVGATLVIPNVIPVARWKAAGVGDFNGDGKAEILWRNTSTGANRLWTLQGAVITSNVAAPTLTDMNWKIAGIGDFDGDGKADILWYHALTGDVRLWLMDGPTLVTDRTLGVVEDLNWKIAGIGDFDGNGKADILWRNTSTGANRMWLMDGTRIASQPTLPTVDYSTGWRVVQVADLDGNGRAEIIWRMLSAINWVARWVMDGGTLVLVSSMSALSPDWRVVGAGFTDPAVNVPQADTVGSMPHSVFMPMLAGANTESGTEPLPTEEPMPLVPGNPDDMQVSVRHSDPDLPVVIDTPMAP